MGSIFSKIIAGEIPSYKIYEDELFYAFLDIRPMAKGHTLLVPKAPIDYIFDIDDGDLSEMMVVSKRIAKAIKGVIPCKKVGVAVVGLEVPHAHIHLIPLNKVGDLRFDKEPVSVDHEEMLEIAGKISSAII